MTLLWVTEHFVMRRLIETMKINVSIWNFALKPLQIGEIMSNNKIMQFPYLFHDGICHVCDIGWCFWKNASWDTIQSLSATSWSFRPPSAPTATPRSLRYLLSCGAVQVLSRSLVCLVSAIFVFVLHPGRPIMLCVSRWLPHRGKSPLTAVKTGYPLTSITWSYRGLRYLPVEVDYFFWSNLLRSY